jgi:hypothetical protein
MMQNLNIRVEMLCKCHHGQQLLEQLSANIREGMCVAFQPYAKANNPPLSWF